MVNRAIRVGAAALATAAVLVATGACGAPEFNYVKNSGEKTYFKVPHGWHEIDEADVEGVMTQANKDSATTEILDQLTWSTAWDANGSPTAAHLLTADTTDQPIVYAKVEKLTEGQRDVVSFDALRNAFGLAVTADARESVEAQGGSSLTGFELLHDEVLTPTKNIHGVRVIYNYEFPNGVMHTFDQTAYVNNDASRLYLLVIRCSARCYKDREKELDTVATSFTIRNRS